jgi:hypothetical protein
MDVLLIENFMEAFRANFNGMIWSLSIESSTDNSCVFTEAEHVFPKLLKRVSVLSNVQ